MRVYLGDLNHAVILRSKASLREGIRKRIKEIKDRASESTERTWGWKYWVKHRNKGNYTEANYQSYGRSPERSKMENCGIKAIEIVLERKESNSFYI